MRTTTRTTPRRRLRPLAVTMAAATILTAPLAACASDDEPTADPAASDGKLGGAVSVMGTWSGAEEDSFRAMVAPWEEQTGTKVEYTGSRDLQTQLTTGIASGNLPDVAGLPGPGLMQEWYAQGAIKPLDFIDVDAYRSATPEGFADLGTAPDGKLIGVFSKAAVKGLVYYDPKEWTAGAPATWDDLVSDAAGTKAGQSATWCVGLESGAASGWPGTDWLEDIVLRQAGPQVYDRWVAGAQKWTSPEIRDAWEKFGEVLDDSYGGKDYVVNTNFGRAANPMFATPPGCLLHHQASFITDFFANEAGATPDDYAFFPFPRLSDAVDDAVTGGGDLVGMFNDTPQARSLMQYLLTPAAQQIWVGRGGFISGNRDVPLDAYPDDASRASAEILQNAKIFRFDASDQFPGALNDAFFKAVVQFAQHPDQLDSILSELDKVQADAYDN